MKGAVAYMNTQDDQEDHWITGILQPWNSSLRQPDHSFQFLNPLKLTPNYTSRIVIANGAFGVPLNLYSKINYQEGSTLRACSSSHGDSSQLFIIQNADFLFFFSFSCQDGAQFPCMMLF